MVVVVAGGDRSFPCLHAAHRVVDLPDHVVGHLGPVSLARLLAVEAVAAWVDRHFRAGLRLEAESVAAARGHCWRA